MDNVQSENVNLHEIPVQALRSKVREKLACMLNKRKLILSPERLCRDYRGLADLMGLCIDNCWKPNDDHIANLLEKSHHSIADLQVFFEKIDRFDVLDDCRDLFYEDAIAYYKQNNQIVPIENDLLTTDDVTQSKKTYDAFLLYVDADMEFAAKIINTLESEYNFKICVKDRLLGGSVFEHSTIMKLISQRCRRLIVLMSNEFIRSDKEKFFLDFAQFHSLEKNREGRFIIPIIYKPCKLPEYYRLYVFLDYMRPVMIKNFWERLYESVLPTIEEKEKNNHVTITELPEPTKSTIKAIEGNIPVENNEDISSSNSFSVENIQLEKNSDMNHPKKIKFKFSKLLFGGYRKKKTKNLSPVKPVVCAS